MGGQACCLIEGAFKEKLFLDMRRFITGECWEQAAVIDADFLRTYRIQHAATKVARAALKKFAPLKREPAGTVALSTRSAVTASRSRLGPRRRRERLLPLPIAPGSVALSMPDGRNGGRGGKPFSRATSSRNAWFSVRSAAIVACWACASARRAALSAWSRRTSPASTSTGTRRSAGKRSSCDAVAGGGIQSVNHAAALSATPAPGNLPRLPGRGGTERGTPPRQPGPDRPGPGVRGRGRNKRVVLPYARIGVS